MPPKSTSAKATTRSSSTSSPETSLNDIMDKLEENRTFMESQFKKFDTLINTLTSRIDLVEQKQSETIQTLTYHGDEILDIKNRLKELDSLRHELAELRSNLKKDTDHVQRSVDILNTEKHLNTLRISGIPERKDENLMELFAKLAKEIQCSDISKEDVESVFRPRVANGNKAPVVLVRFKSITKRDVFYKHRNKLHALNVTSKTLGLHVDNRLYINESLCRTTQSLYYLARRRKAELNYEFIWTYHSQIYVRKSKNTDTIKIIDQQSIDNLV